MSEKPSTTDPKAPEDWRVGLFFLTHYPADDKDGWAGKPHNQGRVKRRLSGDAYEVQFYSWFDGEPSNREVKQLAYFDGASWYAEEEDWVRAGSKGIGNNQEEAVDYWREMKKIDARYVRQERTPRKSSKRRNKAGAAIRKLRFDVFMRDGFKCRYCGRSPPAVELHVDHVVPISKGGTDNLSNMAASCAECNCGKRDKTLHVVKPEKEPTP